MSSTSSWSLKSWISGRSSIRTSRSNRSLASNLSVSSWGNSAISVHSQTTTYAQSSSSDSTITARSRVGSFALSTSSTDTERPASPTSTSNPGPTPPLNHPRSHNRYNALTRAHVAAVAELDAIASTLLFGFSAVHKHAEGELRAAAAWVMLEIIEAHFETTNDLATQRYDRICSWEPENEELRMWSGAMEARYVLKMRESLHPY